ncbi:hypothetical protein [Clostridium lundense]|nr:hypothetical protein [Clostridium lundense]
MNQRSEMKFINMHLAKKEKNVKKYYMHLAYSIFKSGLIISSDS